MNRKDRLKAEGWTENTGQFGCKGPDLSEVDIIVEGSLVADHAGDYIRCWQSPSSWDWSPQYGAMVAWFKKSGL